MRVRAVFIGWMLAVAGIAAVGAAFGLAARVHDLRAAQAAKDNVDALAASLQTVEAIALERGESNAALRRATAASSDDLERLNAHRARTNAALQVTLSYAQHLGDTPVADVQRLAQRLGELRNGVDREMVRPKAERDVAVVDRFLPATLTMVDEFASVENILEGAVARADPAVGQFGSIARVATNLRDFAGRIGNFYVDLMSTNVPASVPTIERVAELRGRVDQNWASLRALIEQADANRELAAEIRRVETEYFDARDKLYAGLLDRSERSIDVDTLRSRQRPILLQMVTLRDAALHAAGTRATEHQTAAMSALLWMTAMMAATLAIGALGVAMFGRRVVFPILDLTRTIVRIANGDRQIKIPHRSREDELGEMANALDTLRANALTAEQAMQQHAERLQDALRSAEGASRAKSSFLATMSHELRTPLNAVIGFSEMIERGIAGPIEPAYVEYAHDIHESASHLLQLINDILDLSTLEAGRFTLSEEKVDLRQTLLTSVRMLTPRAETGQIELVTEVEREPMPVLCDERRIRQVALNLLSNAVKYTQAGGRVVARLSKEHDGTAVLSFQDTGIGIAEADLALVMAPFGRADTAFSRATEGTGLGLPLTKRLVEAHGGVLLLHSTPGAGTTATVRLPPWRDAAVA